MCQLVGFIRLQTCLVISMCVVAKLKGLTGGVNYTSYLDEENNAEDSWESSESDTNSTQIGEMKGKELEKNLQTLKAIIELHKGRKTVTTILDTLGKDMSSKG